ncbi:GNAT family N-acetyltransferase [Jatrophihabitans sp. DSM 45814]
MTQDTEAARFVIIDVPPADLPAKVDEAMAIYVAAMGYLPATGKQRAAHALKHSTYSSFRFRAAVNGHGRLIGFGYGYTSVPGQWWHDLVRKAIGKQGASWLDNAFELSELHVSPASQGMGAGERILNSLSDGLPHRTMVLSTPEGENRAWRLYRRVGFVDLARNHLFPGDHRPFGVLGATLPLAGRAASEDPLDLGLR